MVWEAGEIPARPRRCNQERNPNMPLSRKTGMGRLGSRMPVSQKTCYTPPAMQNLRG